MGVQRCYLAKALPILFERQGQSLDTERGAQLLSNTGHPLEGFPQQLLSLGKTAKLRTDITSFAQ